MVKVTEFVLLLFIFVCLRSKLQINSFWLLWEKDFFKMLLKFFLCNLLYHLDFLLLTIKLVFVSRYLSPMPTIFFCQVDVLLLKLYQNSLLLYLKLLLWNFIYFFSNLDEEIVDWIDNVLTWSFWRLNHELGANNIPCIDCSGKHNIAQLLLGSKLIEKRLIQILHNDLISQILTMFIALHSNLVICDCTRVIIC
jgi:hypothetical protein